MQTTLSLVFTCLHLSTVRSLYILTTFTLSSVIFAVLLNVLIINFGHLFFFHAAMLSIGNIKNIFISP